MTAKESRKVFVGIGSNAGDRFANLRAAIDALPGVVAVSTVYETEAVGDKHGSADHLNAVVELETALPARELLSIALEVEARQGRDRSSGPGPCALDVDVLLVEGETWDEADLEVPHPRMWGRRFVLAPLRDLAPDLVAESMVLAAEGEVRPAGSL